MHSVVYSKSIIDYDKLNIERAPAVACSYEFDSGYPTNIL